MTDTAKTMVERVAWEICKAGWENTIPPAPLPVAKNAFEMHKKAYLAQARAAIAAMAEPTHAMQRAGSPHAGVSSTSARRTFNAMIRAALAEKPE